MYTKSLQYVFLGLLIFCGMCTGALGQESVRKRGDFSSRRIAGSTYLCNKTTFQFGKLLSPKLIPGAKWQKIGNRLASRIIKQLESQNTKRGFRDADALTAFKESCASKNPVGTSTATPTPEPLNTTSPTTDTATPVPPPPGATKTPSVSGPTTTPSGDGSETPVPTATPIDSTPTPMPSATHTAAATPTSTATSTPTNTPLNGAPRIDVSTTLSVFEGETASLKFSTTDPDNDAVTIRATNLPRFVTLAEQSFAINPVGGDAGEYRFTLFAQDGKGASTIKTIALVVQSQGLQATASSNCTDGIDNDDNGLADEQDIHCSRTPYMEYDTTKVPNNSRVHGWTMYEPIADSSKDTKCHGSKLLYVSASGGSDSNSGASPTTPVKSLYKASALLNSLSGCPGWLLLKRGDVWSNQMLNLELAGRSESQQMVIGAYGDIRSPRPQVKNGAIELIAGGPGADKYPFSFISILDLDFYASASDPSSPDFKSLSPPYSAINFLGGGRYIHIENVRARFYGVAYRVSPLWGGQFSNISIHRSVAAFSSNQGMYSTSIRDFSFTENIFHHNGYNNELGQYASMFRHGLYAFENTNFLADNNIVDGSSSFAIKMSSDTFNGFRNYKVTNNLFRGSNGLGEDHSAGRPNGTGYTHAYGQIRRNVFTEMGTPYWNGGTTIRQDVMHWTRNASDASYACNFYIHKPLVHIGGVYNNLANDPNLNTRISFVQNTIFNWLKQPTATYINNLSATEKFITLGNAVMQPAGNYPDPYRTVGKYYQSIGGTDSADAFMSAAINQSKDNWNAKLSAKAVNSFLTAGFGFNPQDDKDCDTIPDVEDSCPNDFNIHQQDVDKDGIGDHCDADDDSDGIGDLRDNCPLAANADQLDVEYDKIGNACDEDDDNDTVLDAVDNCPLIANLFQTDSNRDGIGDACTDSDGDGVFDTRDNCPSISNSTQGDFDGDGFGDSCDSQIQGNSNCVDQQDNDGDGKVDTDDQDCKEFPFVETTQTNGSRVGGFTIYKPSGDTKRIYVSDSTGSDSNSGLSPSSPVKTIAKGLSLLRNNYPDWLLLKRGDVWNVPGSYINLEKSGRAPLEPIVIAAYGESGPRPKLKNTGFNYYQQTTEYSLANLVISGLHFHATGEDPRSEDFGKYKSALRGMLLGGLLHDILVEDNKFEYYSVNLSLQGGNTSTLAMYNNAVRLNIIVGASGQGMYYGSGHHCTLEGNLVLNNGAADAGKDNADIYRHGVYMSLCKDCSVLGNVWQGNGNMHIKVSSDVLEGVTNLEVADNAFLGGSAHHFSLDHSAGPPNVPGAYTHMYLYFHDNVHLNPGRKFADGREQGAASWVLNISNALFEHNVFTHRTSTYGGGAILAPSGSEPNNDIEFSNNVIFNWRSSGSYVSSSGSTTNFRVIDNQIDLAAETYPDPFRDVASYDEFIGGNPNSNFFIAQAQRQSRMNWDPRATADAFNHYIRSGFGR